jgi:hypothetical protein
MLYKTQFLDERKNMELSYNKHIKMITDSQNSHIKWSTNDFNKRIGQVFLTGWPRTNQTFQALVYTLTAKTLICR